MDAWHESRGGWVTGIEICRYADRRTRLLLARRRSSSRETSLFNRQVAFIDSTVSEQSLSTILVAVGYCRHKAFDHSREARRYLLLSSTQLQPQMLQRLLIAGSGSTSNRQTAVAPPGSTMLIGLQLATILLLALAGEASAGEASLPQDRAVRTMSEPQSPCAFTAIGLL